MNRIVYTSFHEEVELERGEQVRKDLAGPGDPRDPDFRDLLDPRNPVVPRARVMETQSSSNPGAWRP